MEFIVWMNLNIKGKGEKEFRRTQGCDFIAEDVKQENMETENMTKSHIHTLAEATTPKRKQFHRFETQEGSLSWRERLYNHAYIGDT